MGQDRSPERASQRCSTADAHGLINDPDHHVVLARRNLLVALAVTGMTTTVDCGGKTGLPGAMDSAETTTSATGGSGSLAAADGGSATTTGGAAMLAATGGEAAVEPPLPDGGWDPGFDAGQADAASWDAALDAGVLLDASDADANSCVRGGCKYCASCGTSGGLDASEGDAWSDAGEADGGMDGSASDAAPDAEAADADVAVCGGCKSCASCGCT